MRYLRIAGSVILYVLLFIFLIKTFSFVPDKLSDVFKLLASRLGIK